MNLFLCKPRNILSHFWIVFILWNSLPSAKAQTFDWALRSPISYGFVNSAAHYAVADLEGNAYMTCEYYGSQDFNPGSGVDSFSPLVPGGNGIYLSKFDAAGHFLWAKNIASSFTLAPKGLVTDRDGNVVICMDGSTLIKTNSGIDTVPPGTSTILAKYDDQGQILWYKCIIGEGQMPMIESIGGLRTDNMGNIYMGGYFTESFDFDQGGREPLVLLQLVVLTEMKKVVL